MRILLCEITNHAIEQHLNICEDCKTAYEQMVSDVGNLDKVPTIQLKFLKKVKRTRLLAAVLCIVLSLILSYMLYASEYKYTDDKGNLSTAITEYTAPFKNAVKAYVLETKEVDGKLVASFKDQSRTNVNGIAVLVKGFNQRYRIIHA